MNCTMARLAPIGILLTAILTIQPIVKGQSDSNPKQKLGKISLISN